MHLSKQIKDLLIALIGNDEIPASWGITNIQIKTNSINMCVDGFNYQGIVNIEVLDDNMFSVSLGETSIGSFRVEEVIKALDDKIEYSDHYIDDLEEWLKHKENININ